MPVLPALRIKHGQERDLLKAAGGLPVLGPHAEPFIGASNERPVIKNPEEDLPLHTQHNESSTKRGRFVMAQLILDYLAVQCMGHQIGTKSGLVFFQAAA